MTLRTLNYGNYGIFLIMGNAGFCPSTVFGYMDPEAFCMKHVLAVQQGSKPSQLLHLTRCGVPSFSVSGYKSTRKEA